MKPVCVCLQASLLSATCSTFIRTLEECMTLANHSLAPDIPPWRGWVGLSFSILLLLFEFYWTSIKSIWETSDWVVLLHSNNTNICLSVCPDEEVHQSPRDIYFWQVRLQICIAWSQVLSLCKNFIQKNKVDLVVMVTLSTTSLLFINTADWYL